MTKSVHLSVPPCVPDLQCFKHFCGHQEKIEDFDVTLLTRLEGWEQI